MAADDSAADRTSGRPSTSDTGSMRHVDALAQRLARLARDLHHDTSPEEVLERTVSTAVAMVPGAEHGAVSLVRARRTIISVAPTSDTARRFDRLQTDVGQGPCLDSAFEHQTTRVDDLAGEVLRWPALAARADEVGAASMLCLQLFVDGDSLGALNLLGGPPGAFTDESEHVGLLLAAHAAIALADARQIDDVARGLAHRDIIGQAKGILMERHKVTAGQAFELLARVSQDANRKLHEVAADLAASGELPDPPPRRPRGSRSSRGS